MTDTSSQASGAPAAAASPSQRDASSSDPQTMTDRAGSSAAGDADATSQSDSSKDIKDPEKHRLSQEAAQYRKQVRELEARVQAFEAERAKAEEAKLSDIERATKRASDAEAKRDETIRVYQERLVRAEIRANASTLQFFDPDDAVRLLDWSELDYDDEGAPTNLPALLERLAQAKPHLVRGGAPAAAGSTPAASPAAPQRPGGGPTAPARSSLTPPPTPVNPRDIPSLTSKDLWTRGR